MNSYTYLSITEDSGCVISQWEKSSASHAPHTETPTSIFPTSRKRKLSHDNHLLRYSSHEIESPFTFDGPPNFLSSTLNESLTQSLQKCNLYTPNFYVERSLSSESSEKRYKLDDSPKFQPKTRSAPSTPTKHLDEDGEHLDPNGKSRSEPLAHYYFSPEVPLGSHEKLALLYPNIQPTLSPTKLKTPEKLREFLRKVSSPAKKRLFVPVHCEQRQPSDPIVLFTVKNDLRHVVSQIFQYLSEQDLCTISKVSRAWRRALHYDRKAFPRYYTYSREYNSNKENVGESLSFREPDTPPLSPEMDSFRRCTKIVSRLTPSQSLHKCLRCMEPAVIQKNVSQCQNPNCLYIYCRNCMSFSVRGPEHFVDKCRMSELIVNKSTTSLNRSSLYDISNGADPSFLVNDSSANQSKYDTSGYVSECDGTPILKRDISLTHQPLQPVSMNKLDNVIRRKIRRSSLVSVVSARTTPQILEVIEPSSPPKVKDVACSKQSKKYLKRLKF